MGLSVREQGEIAYLRGVLGLDLLEERLAKLENREVEVLTLEERASAAKAALAELEVYGATPYTPEHVAKTLPKPDPDENRGPRAYIDESEVVHEDHPAEEGLVAQDQEVVTMDAEDVDVPPQSDQPDNAVKRDDPATSQVPPSASSEPQEDLDALLAEDEEDYDSWTVDDLKTELSERDLSTSGKKADLVARLREDDSK